MAKVTISAGNSSKFKTKKLDKILILIGIVNLSISTLAVLKLFGVI